MYVFRAAIVSSKRESGQQSPLVLPREQCCCPHHVVQFHLRQPYSHYKGRARRYADSSPRRRLLQPGIYARMRRTPPHTSFAVPATSARARKTVTSHNMCPTQSGRLKIQIELKHCIEQEKAN